MFIRQSILVVPAAALLAFSPRAQAEELWFNPGVLFSHSLSGQGTGLGTELSLMRCPGDCVVGGDWSIGGLLQAQWVSGGRSRYALGLQTGQSGLGGELGWALLTQGDGEARTSGPHLAAYLSVGYVSVALRLTVPVEGDAAQLPGPDLGIVVGAKVPLELPDFALPSFAGLPIR